MNLLKRWRAGPVARLTLGLVALVLSILMALDLVFGVIPDQSTNKRHLRQQFAESLAVQVASLAEAGDQKTLDKTLQQVVGRNPDVLSVAVRQTAGYIAAQRGDHRRHWAAPESGRSTLDQVRVPINAAHEHWGDVEIAFASAAPQGVRAWLTEPIVLLLGAFSVAGLLIFYPYLRRALHFLDPSAAIPDRVRKAFDALTDGVVVVDPDGRVVLANESFRRFHPSGREELHGRKLSEVAWLQVPETSDGTKEPPWEQVFRDGNSVAGYPLSVARPDGEPIELIVGGSAITDNAGRIRGCMVTFDDVTEIHRSNEQLRRTLLDLERSREKILAQNEELTVLATRDPLTGCTNRRAFFELAGNLFAERLRTNGDVCCIMADIDHFKNFNDVYGHSVGDQVIQVVARTLGRNMRTGDVLCRYGGEEFCILLPDADTEQARAIAERMRASIESSAVEGVRSTRVERITSSFGVASIDYGAMRLEELIDQADNALYKSKENGRNRVTVWVPQDD
jgi:diguanylate cyclase (GGDEF)-like protein/PAS domain S-box-containing protein